MIIIGHRGARGLAPENTLEAIHEALKYHVDEVEIDIRITRDGIPVLGHNRAIPTDKGGLIIAEHTLTELQTAKKDITTLSDALTATKGRALLYIEVKHNEPVQPVADAILASAAQNKNTGGLLLGSKSQKTLRELHRLLPDVPKIVIEPWSGVRAHYRAKQVNTRRISMRSWWLWRGFLKAMHKRGYRITPYTINNPVKAAKWQPYIYGVITDYPDRFSRPPGQ